MKLEQVVNVDSGEFREVWRIYQSSFPSNERRSLDQQIRVMKHKAYKLLAVRVNKEIIGLLASWDLNKFFFIEHLAVKEDLRNRGLGTNAMKEYIATVKKNIILETKKPVSRTAKFYERLGFKLNTHDYLQPPYSKDKKAVPLFLMSYPKVIAEKEFNSVREQIHKVVYSRKKPLI